MTTAPGSNHVVNAEKGPEPIAIVEMAYWVCLQRPIDNSGKVYWRDLIEQNAFSYPKLIDGLLHSPEYQALSGGHAERTIAKVADSWTKTVKDIARALGFERQLNRDHPQPMDLVAMAYWVFLQRPLDDVGRLSWAERIARGEFSPRLLVQQLLRSPEYLMLNRTPFPKMVHLARLAWIKKLPFAARILDIGGSSPNISEGALIELGYPHRPQELVIFDLPPEEQYWGVPRHPQDRIYTFEWGCLSYIHGRCERIGEFSELTEQRFDLVFMGQVIEHIEPEALPTVLRWIHGHLSHGGQFVFDTPNRALTEIQSPTSYIDPDHKKEYRPNEVRILLERNGFQVKSATGLLPMPASIAAKQFRPMETYDHPLLCENAAEGYLFAMECTKSG